MSCPFPVGLIGIVLSPSDPPRSVYLFGYTGTLLAAGEVHRGSFTIPDDLAPGVYQLDVGCLGSTLYTTPVHRMLLVVRDLPIHVNWAEHVSAPFSGIGAGLELTSTLVANAPVPFGGPGPAAPTTVTTAPGGGAPMTATTSPVSGPPATSSAPPPGGDPTPPSMGAVSVSPSTIFWSPCSGSPTITGVTVPVTDPSGVGAVSVAWQVSGTSLSGQASMSGSGSQYHATIGPISGAPKPVLPKSVSITVTAKDTAGHTATAGASATLQDCPI